MGKFKIKDLDHQVIQELEVMAKIKHLDQEHILQQLEIRIIITLLVSVHQLERVQINLLVLVQANT